MSSRAEVADSAREITGDVVRPAPGERRRSFGFILASSCLVLLGMQTSAPTAVYAQFASQWDLSQLQVNTVFASFVLGLLATLLTAGALSDFIGRRPVSMLAMGVALASGIVFLSAQGLGWLIVGRALQGAAMGLGSGALGVAIMDNARPERSRLAILLPGALPPVGLSLGGLVGSALAQFTPWPRYAVFGFLAAVSLAFCVLTVGIPEHYPRRPGALRSLVPSAHVPPQTRAVFISVIWCMMASWAFAGLFLSLGPSIAKSRLGLDAPMATGLAVFFIGGCGAATGLLSQRFQARPVLLVGCVTLVIGSACLAAALFTSWLWLFYASAITGGVGFGAGFQAGLRLVLGRAPELQRASVMSTTYLVCYLAFGIPSIVAGFLVPSLGLVAAVSLYAAFVTLCSALAFVLVVLQQHRSGAEGAYRTLE